MSYGSAPTPAKRGGGGLIIMVVIAIGAFLLFSNRGGAPRGGDNDAAGHRESTGDVLAPGNGRAQSDRHDRRGFGGGGDFDGRAMPASGASKSSSDWAIEDVGASRNAPDHGSTLPQRTQRGSKTTDGDWSIEDADARSQRSQFDLSNPGGSKSGGGDWNIEDVDDKKPHATEKGDWTIED